MLTIIAKVDAPVGQAIGVKEDLAMRFEDLGDVRQAYAAPRRGLPTRPRAARREG